MEIDTFDEFAADLQARIAQMVWCNLATVDTRGHPRSRIVQPIWAGQTAWIATRRQGLKAQHIAANAAVSLAYIGDNVCPVYVDGVVAWADDLPTKRRVWELARTAPPPLDYDLTPLYQSADNPAFGVLVLTPWRIELANMFEQPRVWRNPNAPRR